MQPAQLQKLKQALSAFETLQDKYKEFGADDRETTLQLHRGIRETVNNGASLFPLSAADWKLFKSMPDAPKVAEALNQAAAEIVAHLRSIDWESPLASVIKQFLSDYCNTPGMFPEIAPPPPLKHSMASYAGAKWIKPANEQFDANKGWEENYKALEVQYVRETTFLINKVRELAANLPGNVMLATKTVHVVQMPDGKYVQDWNSSPASFEVFTVADPFAAVHFPEQTVQQVFKTYFAPRGGKIVPITMLLKVVDTNASTAPAGFIDRTVDKLVRSLRDTKLMKAFAQATRKHVR